MIQNAIYIAADSSYFHYAAALTRSIAKQACQVTGFKVDVHLILHDVPESSVSSLKEDLKSSEIIRLFCDTVCKNQFDLGPLAKGNDNLFFKQSRFRAMEETLPNYEVACLLDADQLVVSPGFFSLFDLVRGTRQMIACNEYFKWTFDERYRDGGGFPLFSTPRYARKFHCSVPILFQPSAWQDILADYNQLALRAYEIDENGNPEKALGDIFTWNAAVERGDRAEDVRLFPMEVMTGVHYTYVLPQTRIRRRDELWYTENGDEVYTLHGRMVERKWLADYLAGGRARASILKVDFDEDAALKLLAELSATWLGYHKDE